MALDANSMNNPRKIIGLILISGLAVGLAFNTPFIIYDLCNYLSRTEPFRQIHLDTTREAAVNILQSNHITCLASGDAQSASKIEFSDFWREYTIYFHPVTHRVVRKVFEFREHASPVKRLLNHWN